MAKLVKSNEEQNTWEVIDDSALFLNSDGNVVNRDGTSPSNDGPSRRVFDCSGEQQPDENSGQVGTVYLDGDGDTLMFIPADGVEHTASHLREVADLMDGLKAAKANAAGA